MRKCIGLLLAIPLFAQTTTPARQDSVVVTGTFEPVPLEELDRSVTVFDLKDLPPLLVNTFADLLRLDSSADLRGRAPNGVQSDLSIRGGTFGQTLVLLNGLRLNDAQSGHHNLDIPVPLEAVSRVEILKGSGSTFYGSDAVGGAVNIITRTPETTELRLRGAAGNFGVNQQSGALTAVSRKLTEQLSFSRDFSTGFRPDRDYRNLSLASITHLLTPLGGTDIVLAGNDRPFGADQFYGNFNSWERTREWFASLRQALGANTETSFGYRRHTDLFVLYRDRPAVFTNRHVDETWQAALRRHDSLRQNVTLHYGGEGYHDSIDSNNLGLHSRSRGAGYAALDVRALRRFSFSLGAREEVFSGGQTQLSPTVSGGVWLSPAWKLRASASRAFRLPSYTDLYYHDPANIGSPDLRPEKASNYEAGLEWNRGGKLRAELAAFHRRERDGIDYVRRTPADIYRATNFQRLNFTGVEATLSTRLAHSQILDFRYTGLTGAQDAIQGFFSKYIFNYPSHSGVVSWQALFPNGFLARTRIGALQRYARDPYAVWDFYSAYSRGRVHPFVQLTNLSNTQYQEILGVPTPGRAVVGGVELVWTSR